LLKLTGKQVKPYNVFFTIIYNIPSVAATGRLNEDSTDNVTYRQWMTTDRSTLDINAQSCVTLQNSFAKKLNILIHGNHLGSKVMQSVQS
jgi:hypothetical protein